MKPISLTLPWPPTVNHYWQRNRNGSVRVGDDGVRFRLGVKSVVMRELGRIETQTCSIGVEIIANFPDRRRRDLDNLLKATLDAIGHAGIYEDDSQIRELTIRKGDTQKPGSLVVTIEELK